MRWDGALAVVVIVGGFMIMSAALMRASTLQHEAIEERLMRREMAQIAQPQQGTPSVTPGKENGPAESKPGGTRPTTPAPEPARPDADAQKAGAAPALPAAPAEKMGEPIKK